MDRRAFIASLIGSSLVTLLVPKETNATGSNLKGFMLATGDANTIKADIIRIADLGGTIVRFPIYFSIQPALQVWFDRLEAAYAVTNQRRVVLVIDMHHPSSSPGSIIENVDDFLRKWRAIAQRFTGRERIWYDLCNEPQPTTPQGLAWQDVALRAAQAIRRIDARSPIVYAAPSTTTASASRFIPLSGITNQILQFHFYDWPELQFNLAPAYPSGNYTLENLQRRLQAVSDVGKKYKLPIYIGEVAINRAHPNAPRFLRDFTSLCDRLGIHLTVHAYREADIWNYEQNPNAWTVLTNWLQRRQ